MFLGWLPVPVLLLHRKTGEPSELYSGKGIFLFLLCRFVVCFFCIFGWIIASFCDVFYALFFFCCWWWYYMHSSTICPPSVIIQVISRVGKGVRNMAVPPSYYNIKWVIEPLVTSVTASTTIICRWFWFVDILRGFVYCCKRSVNELLKPFSWFPCHFIFMVRKVPCSKSND